MNFRSDINGLRAIAVIAVVLFHFNPAWVPGGFAGVDVFFVISGFLMTGIIFKGFEENTFNLFGFYVARANRIIPALAVLCAVLLAFSWFYLAPLEYRELGKHAASSMGFLSNVVYLRESGYFDVASHEKWLLHTWSLSVEWQFYIIFPVVLLILKKITSIKSLKYFLVVGTVLGFVFSVFATFKWPNPSYYLLPTRAWEMMFGGLAYLFPWKLKETKRKFIELTGLALIGVSYALISSEKLWPGYLALVPVLGAYLIIIANRQNSILTNNLFFQLIGKWSYSIYLWHWPIVVYGYYFDISNWWLGVLISLFFGCVSFNLIEKLKFKKWTCWKDLLKVKPLCMVFVSGSLSVLVYSNDGFISRLEFEDGLFDNLSSNELHKINNKICHGQSLYEACGVNVSLENKNILLLGDSHAGTLGGNLYSLSKKMNWGYLQSTRGGCTGISTIITKPNNGNLFIGENCLNFSNEISSYLENNNTPRFTIVYVTRLALYLNGTRFNNTVGGKEPGDSYSIDSMNGLSPSENIINKLSLWSSLGHQLVIVYPIPEVGWSVPLYVQKELYKTNEIPTVVTPYKVYKKRTKTAFSTLNKVTGNNVIRVYPDKVFCSKAQCRANDKNSLYYSDYDHLSIHGAELLVKQIESQLL